MNNKPSKSLSRAAQLASRQPFFLASVLHTYQVTNHLEDEDLATLLGCHLSDLPRIGLCRRPDANSAAFASEVEQLAQRFQLQGVQLASIIRQVDAVDALRQHNRTVDVTPRMLWAARDRDDSAEPPEDDHD